MKTTYITISVLYPHFRIHEECGIAELAIKNFGCSGVEEYSYSEAEVDELLGERSYSGGDLTLEIYEELESDAKEQIEPIVHFYFEDEKAADQFHRWLSELDIHLEVKKSLNDKEDWNAYWRAHYQEISIVDDFKIIPSWKKKESDHSHNIYIYPGMGFGTGSHETTFLCLLAMLEYKLTFKDVLDFGCGSGILGIGAIKLNPEAQVDFYDIDPEALDNCRENLTLNELEVSKYPCLLPIDREQLKPVDLVFANILRNVLELECESLVNYTKNGGHIILSGLLTHQAEDMITLYSQSLKLIKRFDKGDWCALLFQKVK